MTSAPHPETVGRLPGVLLLLGSCMAVLAAVLLTPVLPIMQGVYRDSPVPAALILSAPALFVAIFAPFAGQIVDRLGRRPLLFVSMFVYAVLGTAPAWLPLSYIESSIVPLLVLRLLIGLCDAAIITCCTTLIGDYYQGQRRNRYLALQAVFTSVSATVFLLLGGVLVGTDEARWRVPFWVYALSLLIVVPMLFVLKEPVRTPHDLAIAAAVARARLPWGRLALPLVVTFFGGVTFFVLIVQAPLVFASVGITDTQMIGIAVAGASVATAVGALLFARAARLTAKVLLPISFGLLGLGLVLVWAAGPSGSFLLSLVGTVVGSFGSGLLVPTLLVWSIGGMSFDERGRSTGLWQAAIFFGQFLSPLVVVALQSGLGGTPDHSLPLALGIIGIACLAVAALVGAFVRPTPLGVPLEPVAAG